MKEVMLIGRRCRPGERFRVAVRYDDAWRPVFWMTVEKQGDEPLQVTHEFTVEDAVRYVEARGP